MSLDELLTPTHTTNSEKTMVETTIDPKEIQRRAWFHGHYWEQDPELSVDDAEELDLNHPLAKSAWESWRKSDANYDLQLQRAHGPNRTPQDDTWGPATDNEAC